MSGERCPVCGAERDVDWAKWLRDRGYTDEEIEKLRSGGGWA